MPGKLKVLILTERFYPEEFIINDLAADWAAGDMQVDVLTQAPSYPFGRVFKGYKNSLFSTERWKNINIYRFFTVTGYRDSLFLKLLNYFSFAAAGTVAALRLARGYDRIFIYQTGPLTLALPAVFARKVYGTPVTIWTQDVWPDMVYAYGFKKTKQLAWFLDKIVGFIYRNCDTILLSCDGFRRSLAPYAGAKPMTHYPNWPTVTPGSAPHGGMKLSDKFNFTFAGNVGKFQNLDNIIRGFAQVSASNPDVQLNIVGDGSELESLKSIVEKEKVGGVVFWGRRPQAEMPAFFDASDVMIVSLTNAPIFELTVPAKFQAYLAFSKPIFCVMNGEVRDLVLRHNTGLCAAPDDIAAIRDGFKEFYSLRGAGVAEFSRKAGELLAARYDRKKIISGIRSAVEAGQA